MEPSIKKKFKPYVIRIYSCKPGGEEILDYELAGEYYNVKVTSTEVGSIAQTNVFRKA